MDRTALRAREKSAIAAAVVLAGAAVAVACLPAIGPDDVARLVEPPPTIVNPCGNGIIESLADGGGEQCDQVDAGDAGVPGCVGCVVQCPEGELDPSTRHCYFAATSESNAVDAVTKCAAANAHVVTIGSATEDAIVERVAANRSYWVGLSYVAFHQAYTTELDGVPFGVEPGWPAPPLSGPCLGCFGKGLDGGGFAPATGEAFDGGTPSVPCVAADVDKIWKAFDCATTHSVICEREPPGSRRQDCAGGLCFTVASTLTRKTYFVAVDEATADEAQTICKQLPGGRLAVFQDADERGAVAAEIFDLFKDLFAGDPTRKFWVGLAFDGTRWGWSDAKSEEPVLWGDRQPESVTTAGLHAYLRVGLLWDSGLLYSSTKLDERNAFLCERSPL